jgi:lycopene beta-cyclase
VGSLDHFQYLLLMVGCLLITLPLEFVLGAPVYRRVTGLAFALIPIMIIFSIWDIAGILRDHWSYSPRFTTGVKLILGMPIEEGLLHRGADLRAAERTRQWGTCSA